MAGVELQDEEPRVRLALERVGFRGVKVLVPLETPEGRMALTIDVDAFVSIDGSRRGVHLSRNVEALRGALAVRGHYASLESYVDAVASELLERHPYASSAWVEARTVIHVRVKAGGLEGYEPVEASVAVEKGREGWRRWRVSASVYGLSVCPSAMGTVKRLLGVEGLAPSHSQRVRVTGRLTYSRGFARIEDVARALYEAPSAPALTLLKREQEAELVLAAHRNPKLAEDIARDAVLGLARLASRLGLPGDTVIEVEVESLESIHPQNVYAAARAVLGDVGLSTG